MLTNSFIIYLIGCEKVIRGIPRKEMTLDRCNWRNDIKMSSKDDQIQGAEKAFLSAKQLSLF